MRHIKYLNGKKVVYEGRIACTHVLIGQRNPELHPEPPDGPKLTAEQLAERKRWIRESVGGRFAITVLEWAKDEAEAEALKAEFPAPEWINLRVEPVDQVTGYI